MKNNFYSNLTSDRKKILDNFYSLIHSEFVEQKNEKLKGKSLLDSNEYRIRTIAIDASWGMGKSFFASALKEKISLSQNSGINIKTLEYNAWKNDFYTDPMKTIIGELNEQLVLTSEVKEKAENLIRNISKKGINLIFKLLLKKLNYTNEDIEEIRKFFLGISNSALDDYKNYKKMVEDFKIALGEEAIIGESFEPKLILVDELDRCCPNFAIEVLETIKHIFDVNNIIFVFLINKSQLSASAENIYGKNLGSEDYFKKFFDLEFTLPNINFKEFFEKNSKEITFASSKNVMLFLEVYHLITSISFIEYKEKDHLDQYKNLEFSAREFKINKIKFEVALKTFTLEEKNSFPLILSFILYFLSKELNLMNDTIPVRNYSEILNDLIKRLFYNGKGGQVDPSNPLSLHDIKEEFLNWSEPLNLLVLTLLYKTGKVLPNHSKKSYIINSCSNSRKSLKSLTAPNFNPEKDSKESYNTGIEVNATELTKNHLFLPLEKSFIDDCYSNNQNPIIEWCKLKYNFISSLS